MFDDDDELLLQNGRLAKSIRPHLQPDLHIASKENMRKIVSLGYKLM